MRFRAERSKVGPTVGGAAYSRTVTSTYLRYPHLRDDLLTFVGADDVWVAPTDGGRAWRLTHDRVPVRNPRLSPDGTTVAYVSHRDGHPEIMVAELDGAAPQRLTWWGAAQTLLLGWSADGRVLAASHAGEANLRHLTVRAVALDGAVERLRYGPAWGVAERADGAVALSSAGSRPPAQWKRYRGGTAPRLWLDRSGDGDWEQLLAQDPASLVDPMWVQDRLVCGSSTTSPARRGTSRSACREAPPPGSRRDPRSGSPPCRRITAVTPVCSSPAEQPSG